MHLILLILSVVLFFLAGIVPQPEPYGLWRLRLIAFGLFAWAASTYPF